MPSTLLQLVRRDSDTLPMNNTIYGLLVALLVLICVALVLIGTLLLFRRRRQQARRDLEASIPPQYTEKRISTASSTRSSRNHHRRVTARPSQSIHIPTEKEMLMQSEEPLSPVESIPEIRVTFPEEVDESGKRQSGKVVVVRVSDAGIGLEPLAEQLPAYQQADGERFQSVDLERVGGLVEKARARPASKWE